MLLCHGVALLKKKNKRKTGESPGLPAGVSGIDSDEETNDTKYPRVICIDCGIKNNIVRYLCRKRVHLTIVPWDFDFITEYMDKVK